MAAKSMRKGTGAFELLSFVLLMVFFVGIALIDGPKWCVDTPSYVDMDFSREPVYPLFLLGLRTLFERLNITSVAYELPAYLTMAVVLQSILWVVAIHRLGIYIYDVCSKAMSHGKARLLMFIAELLQVAVAFLNRFAAKRGAMYSESLMTESLAMPLFVLFTILLLRSFEDYKISNCIKLFLMAVLISSVRKQMLIVVLMWGFSSFVLHLLVKSYRSLKKFSYTVIFAVLTIVAVSLFDRGYNQAVRGVFATHTGNSKGGLCTVLYTAVPEDVSLFDGDDKYPEIGSLFTKIMDECQKQQLTIDYAEGYERGAGQKIATSNWTNVTSHYADSYDVIGFDIVQPMCDEYVAQHYPELEGAEAKLMEDVIEKELFQTLLSGVIAKVFGGEGKDALYVLKANVLKAFVISNANISPAVLIKISLIIYGIYLALFVALMVRTIQLTKKVPNDQTIENLAVKRKMLIMGLVVMAGLAINCVVTGSMIFPQPRYMCYSMGLFYLSMYCNLVGIYNSH